MTAELGLVLATVAFFIFMLSAAMIIPFRHFSKLDEEKYGS